MQEKFMNHLENIIREGMENRDRSVFMSFASDGSINVSIDPWPESDKGEQYNTISFDCVLENNDKAEAQPFTMKFKEKEDV